MEQLRVALYVYDAMPVHEADEKSIRGAEGQIIMLARDVIEREAASPALDVDEVIRDIRAHFMEGLSDREYDSIRSIILARAEYARLTPEPSE